MCLEPSAMYRTVATSGQWRHLAPEVKLEKIVENGFNIDERPTGNRGRIIDRWHYFWLIGAIRMKSLFNR
jgi:hypothetical protein